METKKLILDIAKKYAQEAELDIYTRRVKLGLLLPEAKLFKNYIQKRGKLLDVGCGCGREALALAKLGYKVVGVDIVYAMVWKARSLAEESNLEVSFCNMDLLNLGIKRESFEVVFLASQVLGHIPKRENRVNILCNIRNILKKEGILVMSIHSRKAKGRWRGYWIFNRILRRIQNRFGSLLEEGDKFAWEISGKITKGRVFLHIYTLEEAMEDLRNAGFKKIYCKSAEELKDNIVLKDKSEDWIIYFWAEK
jgi:2-polyprenyl-3-methyl-5-hydroxy-6-metoxy-1,4-benzoquinol methylase